MSVSIDKNSYLPDYNSFDIFGKHKLPFIFLLVIIIIIFIFIFSFFNSSSSEGSKTPVLILEIILWVTLVIIVVLNAKWLSDKHMSFTAEISDIFNDNITNMNINAIDPSTSTSDTTKTCTGKEDGEVYHIPGNNYKYSDALTVCKSLNARLATYDEVEDAYNNGASWCSYGWSDDQMALFPTQKSIYNDLKNTIGHEHDCGRPGINGGYIHNQSSTFGVNCYGKKPYITDADKAFMDKYSLSPSYPDSSYNNAEKASDILIAPFNKSKWSFD